MVVDNYLGSKLGDALQKTLREHSADLIHKHSVKPAPESSKIQTSTINLEQESKKISSEIRKIKREQADMQKMLKYTIKSTNKASLKEYDLKSVLYQTMHENKSFNKNLANHALYHELMEALIEDENVMDKRVHPEWNKRQVVLDQSEQPWFNQMVSAIKDPFTFNDLMATSIDFSNIELEYNFQECFNALTEKLDWNNPEGDHLEFLTTSDPEKTYTTSITKTKAAQYEIVGIKDMTLHFGVLSNMRMTKMLKKGSSIRAKGVSFGTNIRYGHLEEIVVKKVDRQLYKFKEGVFVDLHLNDIEDMMLLIVQHKTFHLNDSDIVDFIVALRMFTRNLIIKRHVEDLQLGVESYQKKLNITAPQKTFPEIKFKELYTPSYKPPGDELHHRILDFHLGYNKEMSRRKWTAIDKKRSELMVEIIDKQMRERQIIQNLERLVGAQELEMDYKLMTRTV
ncbi:hypothetical protein Tco_0618009 [Tanacetum coccineum]